MVSSSASIQVGSSGMPALSDASQQNSGAPSQPRSEYDISVSNEQELMLRIQQNVDLVMKRAQTLACIKECEKVSNNM